MKKKMIPYTYLIGWSKENKFYYGVRYSSNCNPNDLWKTYFTSSKHVKAFRKQYGEPDIVQVRKVFVNKDSAIEWENKVLRRMKVVLNEQWLNKNDLLAPPVMKGKNHPLYGKGHTEESKRKMSINSIGKLKGIPKTFEHRTKISEGLKNQSLELRDKRRKMSVGSKNSNAKLTENVVIEILCEFQKQNILPNVGKLGKNNRLISYEHEFSKLMSIKYNVSIGTIKMIIKGETWKHIKKQGN